MHAVQQYHRYSAHEQAIGSTRGTSKSNYIPTSHFQVGSPKAVPETAAMVAHFALLGGVCKVLREQGAPLGL